MCEYPPCKTFLVDIVLVVAACDILFERVHIVGDVLHLLIGDFIVVWVFEGIFLVVFVGDKLYILVPPIGIALNYIAGLVDVDTFFATAYCLGENINASVVAINKHIYISIVGSPIHAHNVGNFQSYKSVDSPSIAQ